MKNFKSMFILIFSISTSHGFEITFEGDENCFSTKDVKSVNKIEKYRIDKDDIDLNRDLILYYCPENKIVLPDCYGKGARYLVKEKNRLLLCFIPHERRILLCDSYNIPISENSLQGSKANLLAHTKYRYSRKYKGNLTWEYPLGEILKEGQVESKLYQGFTCSGLHSFDENSITLKSGDSLYVLKFSKGMLFSSITKDGEAIDFTNISWHPSSRITRGKTPTELQTELKSIPFGKTVKADEGKLVPYDPQKIISSE